MAQNSESPKLEQGACAEGKWTINNWINSHKKAVAAGSSCYIEVGNPKVGLRFFLRPKEKLYSMEGQCPILNKWYSLCAEVSSQVNENIAVEVKADLYSGSSMSQIFSKSGVISLYKSKGKVVEVIDPFIYFESSTMNQYGELGAPNDKHPTDSYGNQKPLTNVQISITAQLFHFTQNNKKMDPPFVEENAEAEESLIHDLKSMFVAHENYADIKLESKDHMTLDSHKFILAARSRYMQKYIDDATKVENFNGTMKMNINGKPLVVILHWMYTGELHETCGNVMEEVVDAAILFELTHLMKLLDKKLITICNKENMFRLYQVAQKNGMPNAMDDISVYIREHL